MGGESLVMAGSHHLVTNQVKKKWNIIKIVTKQSKTVKKKKKKKIEIVWLVILVVN